MVHCSAGAAAPWAVWTMEAGERKEKPRRRLSVAVIGAGAAGLVATHELRKEGHHVVVFEQQSAGVGGVWRYTDQVDDGCILTHASMYLSLRTNLPREVMGFLDFPFLAKHHDCNRDARRYPHHAEVLSYLQDFAFHFDILPSIRFGRRVIHISGRNKRLMADGQSMPCPTDDHVQWSIVSETKTGSLDVTMDLMADGQSMPSPTDDHMQWSVVSETKMGSLDVTTDLFDAVVVCNGHYFQPKLASIPGIDKWPGKQLHSHNYRVPHPFTDQVVVVIGISSSGSDISREIATVAKEVHLVGRRWDSSIDMKKRIGPLQNITPHPMVKSAHENGELIFEDGSSIVADIILYCTGYAYSMPFLHTQGVVNVDREYVGPLYQHVFPPLLAPTLSFVGLPFKVVPFPLMQLQSKWIAMCLSGKVLLPSKEKMFLDTEKFYKEVEARGDPKSKIHDLGLSQFEYDNWLAIQCGCDPIEQWRIQIYLNSGKRKQAFPDIYRDEWTDHELQNVAIAHLSMLAQHSTDFI